MNIVITGATKGIGRAIAEKFAQNGYNLVVCARKEQDLEQMQEDFKEKHPNISLHYQATDVSKKEEVKKFAEFVGQHLEKIDVLVNNAGVFIPGAIYEEEEGALEMMIETNLYSAYHLSRALLPKMMEQKSGHIFNMCSIASKIAYPNGGSYSISKFALLGFSKVLREELKPHNIRVTSILPGATWSASWDGVDLPEERLMKAEDIAEAVYASYILSKQSVVEEIVLRPQLGDL